MTVIQSHTHAYTHTRTRTLPRHFAYHFQVTNTITTSTVCFYLYSPSVSEVRLGQGSVWGEGIRCEGRAAAAWGSVEVRQREVQVVLRVEDTSQTSIHNYYYYYC